VICKTNFPGCGQAGHQRSVSFDDLPHPVTIYLMQDPIQEKSKSVLFETLSPQNECNAPIPYATPPPSPPKPTSQPPCRQVRKFNECLPPLPPVLPRNAYHTQSCEPLPRLASNREFLGGWRSRAGWETLALIQHVG
jgi:hypothetical protein